MTIRIGVMIDVDAKTPEEAYSKLYDFFAKHHEMGIDWESTDEWFDHDGEEIHINDVERARDAHFKKVEPLLKMKELDPEVPVDAGECPICHRGLTGSDINYLGALGSRHHYRCRHCGMEFSREQRIGD